VSESAETLRARFSADLSWLGGASALMDADFWAAAGFRRATAPVAPDPALAQVCALLDDMVERGPNAKVGRHFEALHDLALGCVEGVELLATQRPLRTQGQTLGELDALYRLAGEVIHREIAVKYYLGVEDSTDHGSWWGPSRRDRLDLKLARMTRHQLRLPQLAQHCWPEALPPPQRSEALMLGVFFRRPGQTTLPQGADPSVECGIWCEHSDFDALNEPDDAWARLHKPWWLSPEQARFAPAWTPQAARQHLEDLTHPVLLSRTRSGVVQRVFVLPDGWWEHPRPAVDRLPSPNRRTGFQ
jgi:hypothetical protein